MCATTVNDSVDFLRIPMFEFDMSVTFSVRFEGVAVAMYCGWCQKYADAVTYNPALFFILEYISFFILGKIKTKSSIELCGYVFGGERFPTIFCFCKSILYTL